MKKNILSDMFMYGVIAGVYCNKEGGTVGESTFYVKLVPLLSLPGTVILEICLPDFSGVFPLSTFYHPSDISY